MSITHHTQKGYFFMDEEWKVVETCPLYEVSNLGRVRRITYKAYYLTDWGYPAVQLWKGNAKYKASTIHRLVAQAFIPNPDNLPEVNHKDGNKLNFRADNLEWVTHTENQRHMIRMGLRVEARGERHGMSKLTDEKVLEIRALDGTMKQRDIAKLFGVDQYTIHAVVSRKTWTHVGGGSNADRRAPGNVGYFRNGSFHPNSKLTEDNIREIRALRHEISIKKIAARFGVHQTSVKAILSGKTWKHVK